MIRRSPNMADLIHATLVGIASHPLVKSNPVTHPIVVDGKPEAVPINRYRAYGGHAIENLQDGVTCSVYPYYQKKLVEGDSIPRGYKSMEFKPYNLGRGRDNQPRQEVLHRLIIELQHQETAIGESLLVPWYQVYPFQEGSAHGLNYSLDPEALKELRQGPTGVQLEGLEIEINPSEEILRRWIEILRLVLDDLFPVLPFIVRSSEIKEADFPSSTWTGDGTDLYFHHAYLVWELMIYPLPDWRGVYPVETIEVRKGETEEDSEVILFIP